jgi:ADP-ribosylglycohydrolase
VRRIVEELRAIDLDPIVGPEQAISFAVRCAGDTDTLGAMAGALAGAACGSTSIPARWLDALENGQRGRRYVERLAGALAETAMTQR